MSKLRETTEGEREVLKYLNSLRDSGTINMMGATPYLVEDFLLEKREARKYLALWMKNYNEEGNYDTVEEN